MKTDHIIYNSDSRDLSELDSDSVELVVTSPPYPMVEMWDSLFKELSDDIDQIESNSFESMHEELDKVWGELQRVVVPGGIVAVNIGDATRKVNGSFRVYQNHSRIVQSFDDLGFEPLPEILWRKPTNSPTKFQGSGMTPPNAYATLEHEYILIFRNGTEFRDIESDIRRESAYFWEERNEWFSDTWEIRGEKQSLSDFGDRDRSAAYPLEIPYRLINMYSVYGDTVLDPFWGTGTTSLASMVCGRNSIGYELDESLIDLFDNAVDYIPDLSGEIVKERMQSHKDFVREESNFKHRSENYGFPVVSRDEVQIQFYKVTSVNKDRNYTVKYDPIDDQGVNPVGRLSDF